MRNQQPPTAFDTLSHFQTLSSLPSEPTTARKKAQGFSLPPRFPADVQEHQPAAHRRGCPYLWASGWEMALTTASTAVSKSSGSCREVKAAWMRFSQSISGISS